VIKRKCALPTAIVGFYPSSVVISFSSFSTPFSERRCIFTDRMSVPSALSDVARLIAKFVVKFEDFRTYPNLSAQRPVDEQALVSGAVLDRCHMVEEEPPAIPVIVPELITSALSDSHAFDRRGLLHSSLSDGADRCRSLPFNFDLRILPASFLAWLIIPILTGLRG